MELSNIQATSDNKDLTFNIKNIDLPYLNGINRTILSEIPSYALHHIEIVKNTTVINNNKLEKKISLIPVDKPIGFTLKVKNDTNLKMHVTSSDMKLYNLNDPEFAEYFTTLPAKRHQNRVEQYEEQGISIEEEVDPNAKTIPEDLANYLKENENTEVNLEGLIEKDIQILILDVGQELEVYGVSIPGIPQTNVKWQQGYSFFSQVKLVNISKQFSSWENIIKNIINELSKIDSENSFNKNKNIGLLFHILRTESPITINDKTYTCHDGIVTDIVKPKYTDFQKIKWSKEMKEFITVSILNIIENICKHIHDMDLKHYYEYQRCISCMDQISHILKLEPNSIYELEPLNKYKVTINSNTRQASLLWNQAINIFAKKIEKLINDIDVKVNVHLKENKNQENGFILKLDNYSHSIGNVIVYELRKESKISNCSYTHTHPLNNYIELHMKWKKEGTNPKQRTINILTTALNRAKTYLEQIPLIDHIN